MCGIVLLFLRNDENFFDLLLFRAVCGCCCFYFGFAAIVVVGICARGWVAHLPFRIVFGNFGAAFSLIIHLLIVDFFLRFWYSYRRNVCGKRRAKPDDAKLRRKSEIFCPYAAVKT